MLQKRLVAPKDYSLIFTSKEISEDLNFHAANSPPWKQVGSGIS